MPDTIPAIDVASLKNTAAAGAGIGLRAPHVQQVCRERPDIGWLEVHSENYFGGGAPIRDLLDLRHDYPISLHGVGLSLGSADGLDRNHLARLKALVDLVDPALVSEHMSWSSFGGVYLNDLIPVPLTGEALDLFCENVDHMQDILQRTVLIENPSSYLRYSDSEMSECEFLSALVARTGCGLLFDVNNVYVTCRNFGLDPLSYIGALPTDAIGEIHLAGYHINHVEGQDIYIDDHGAPVYAPVWDLYRRTLEWLGPRPTLIEWDSNIPPLETLLGEAEKARDLLQSTSANPAVGVQKMALGE